MQYNLVSVLPFDEENVRDKDTERKCQTVSSFNLNTCFLEFVLNGLKDTRLFLCW